MVKRAAENIFHLDGRWSSLQNILKRLIQYRLNFSFFFFCFDFSYLFIYIGAIDENIFSSQSSPLLIIISCCIVWWGWRKKTIVLVWIWRDFKTRQSAKRSHHQFSPSPPSVVSESTFFLDYFEISFLRFTLIISVSWHLCLCGHVWPLLLESYQCCT